MTRTSVMTALLGGMIFILPLTAKGQAEIEAQRYRFDVNMTPYSLIAGYSAFLTAFP